MRDRRLHGPHPALRFTQEAFGRLPGRSELAAPQIVRPSREIGIQRRLGIAYFRRKLPDAREGRLRFVGGEALGPHHGLAVASLQFQALTGRSGLSGVAPRSGPANVVREFNRLAKVRDRLSEGGAAQRLVAGFAPPFDRKLRLARLREVMRERLGLQRGRGQQNLGRAPVQRLAAALQQAVVGGVLYQRVLEAIVRVRRDAFDEQQLGVGEFFERGVEETCPGR